MSGITNLGLLVGQETSIDALGVFGHLIHRSRTVHEAIETAMHTTAAFSSGIRCSLAHDGDRARLCPQFGDGVAATYRQASEYCLMLALNLLRLAAGPHWRRDDVLLETTSAGGFGDVDLVSDARIVFRQRETAVTFPRWLLSRPLQTYAARQIEERDVEAWKASGRLPSIRAAGDRDPVFIRLSPHRCHRGRDRDERACAAAAVGRRGGELRASGRRGALRHGRPSAPAHECHGSQYRARSRLLGPCPLHPRLSAVDGGRSARVPAGEPEDTSHVSGDARGPDQPGSWAGPEAG